MTCLFKDKPLLDQAIVPGQNEVRMIRACSDELVNEAIEKGFSSFRFHRYQVRAHYESHAVFVSVSDGEQVFARTQLYKEDV